MAKPDLIEIPSEYIGGYKKRATSGIVVSWGSRCKFSYRKGQRVHFRFLDHRPGIDGNRFVREQELLASEDDV